MVKTFRETWDAIESALKANAATLGVDVSAIKKGDRETPQRAPFLTVYLLPSNFSNSESSAVFSPRATCLVFCGIQPAKTLAESINLGVEMAVKVLGIVDAMPEVIIPSSPLEFDEDNPIFTAISVQFTVRFRP